jgi:hypothetical protein
VLNARPLQFQPTRGDVTVGTAILSVYCACDDAQVNGGDFDMEWYTTEPHAVSVNMFEMDRHEIVVSRTNDRLLCLSMKVFFNEISFQYDALYYENVEDRYSLLSYCTGDRVVPWNVDTRFGMNRVETFEEFDAALSQPFTILLNDRPLP